MAQKTVVTVVCDLHHDGEIEGIETVSFAFDGASYEIDVCSAHAKELHDTFAPYTEHSRRVSGGAGGASRARGRVGSAVPISAPGPGSAATRSVTGGAFRHQSSQTMRLLTKQALT